MFRAQCRPQCAAGRTRRGQSHVHRVGYHDGVLMKRSSHIHKSHRGVGLIEVLIALLVLSFGMLGMAGLQMWSLRYNHSAMQRGMAVVETHTIADAMRADRAAARRSEFDISLDAEPPSGNTFAQV